MRVVLFCCILALSAWLAVGIYSWWNTPSILVDGGFMYDEAGNVIGMWDRWVSPADEGAYVPDGVMPEGLFPQEALDALPDEPLWWMNP